jgi:hypothetical protein
MKCLLFHLLALFIFCAACKKEKSGATALLKVRLNGVPVAQPAVYIKRGAVSNPGIPFAQYDDTKVGDDNGIVYFEGLQADDYFFAASITIGAATYTGEVTMNVVAQTPGSRYEKVIVVY